MNTINVLRGLQVMFFQHCLSVLLGTNRIVLFKITGEVREILKSQFIGDLTDRDMTLNKHPFGFQDNSFPDKLAGGFARCFFYGFVEVMRRYTQGRTIIG